MTHALTLVRRENCLRVLWWRTFTCFSDGLPSLSKFYWLPGDARGLPLTLARLDQAIVIRRHGGAGQQGNEKPGPESEQYGPIEPLKQVLALCGTGVVWPPVGLTLWGGGTGW
jgi:hypothetical protein